jgi:hypothetical protein
MKITVEVSGDSAGVGTNGGWCVDDVIVVQ